MYPGSLSGIMPYQLNITSEEGREKKDETLRVVDSTESETIVHRLSHEVAIVLHPSFTVAWAEISEMQNVYCQRE